MSPLSFDLPRFACACLAVCQWSSTPISVSVSTMPVPRSALPLAGRVARDRVQWAVHKTMAWRACMRVLPCSKSLPVRTPRNASHLSDAPRGSDTGKRRAKSTQRSVSLRHPVAGSIPEEPSGDAEQIQPKQFQARQLQARQL